MGTEPWQHPLWRMAEAYGARCCARCEDSVTHVVACARGTDKTLWAAQHGRAVVTPAWCVRRCHLSAHLSAACILCAGRCVAGD